MAETIQNIDLSIFNKKKFKINNDENRILELDTSDFTVIARLAEFYPKLEELQIKYQDIKLSNDNITESLEVFKQIDNEMRSLVDTIFDSNVCEVCVPSGTMYDLYLGQPRFEILITKLSKLYDDNLDKELKKLRTRTEKHTAKYTKVK